MRKSLGYFGKLTKRELLTLLKITHIFLKSSVMALLQMIYWKSQEKWPSKTHKTSMNRQHNRFINWETIKKGVQSQN